MQEHLRRLLIFIFSIKVLLFHVNGQNFESIYNYVRDSCYKDTNNYMENLKPGEMYCDVIFTGACWPQARAGFTVVRPCPYLFFRDTGGRGACVDACQQSHIDKCRLAEEFISRRCNETGSWESMNFSECQRLTERETEEVILGIVRKMNMTAMELKSKDPYMEQSQVFVTCSWISFVSLLLSLLVLVNLADKENERFKLHKNLLTSYFVKILLFFVDHYAGLSKNSALKGLCSAFWVVNRYFAVAEVTWMLTEAIVLLRRITHALDARLEYKHLLMWGWGFPAFLTFLVYVPVMITVSNADQRCWSYHGQSLEMLVLYAPMTVMLVINFGIMLFIIRILISKMRDENFSEARIVWKAAKGALVLMPLMGFLYLIIFYTPVDDSRFDIYASVFYPLQGIVVCLFYVLFNREVQKQMIHQWKKWSADKCLKNGRRNVHIQSTDVQELEEPAPTLSPPAGELNSFFWEYNTKPAIDIHSMVGRVKGSRGLHSAVSVMSHDSYLVNTSGAAHGSIYSKHNQTKNSMVCVASRKCYSQNEVNHTVGCFV